MAHISTFRGIRYREDIALDEVVAPPYDVLSAAQAADLRARSPHNAVHVDLPVPPGARGRRRRLRRTPPSCSGAGATRARWCATSCPASP